MPPIPPLADSTFWTPPQTPRHTATRERDLSPPAAPRRVVPRPAVPLGSPFEPQSALLTPIPRSRATASYAAQGPQHGPTRIREGLYLGGVDDVRSRMALLTLDITHILSVAAEYPPPRIGDIKTKHVPLVDKSNERVTPHFKETLEWIDAARAAGQRVLVHCQHGISRSVTMVLAYLMVRERKTLSMALQDVRALRPEAEPNPGFLQELRLWEREIFGEMVSTDALTRLDPGPVRDVLPQDAHVQDAVNNCLAAASVERPGEERDAREMKAAGLIDEGSVDVCKAQVMRIVTRGFESFATLAKRDKDARASLQRIVVRVSTRGDLCRVAVICALSALHDPQRLQELKTDVPFAALFLSELIQFFAQQSED